jgi:hypothetical protein
MGLASDGIEVYFPLSDRLVLGMLCPSYQDKMVNTLLGEGPKNPVAETKFRELIREGMVFDLSEANVENLNSLQVFQARRFVFAGRGGFQLARRMAKVEPELNHALKMEEQFSALREEMNSKPRLGVRSKKLIRLKAGIWPPYRFKL